MVLQIMEKQNLFLKDQSTFNLLMKIHNKSHAENVFHANYPMPRNGHYVLPTKAHATDIIRSSLLPTMTKIYQKISQSHGKKLKTLLND